MLIRPGSSHPLVQELGLEQLLGASQLYVAVVAGGFVEVGQVRRYQQSEGASDVLSDLFSNLRLPQSIDGVEDIPRNGEVIRTRLGGYLGIGAGLTWGYAFAGTRGFELRDLKLELDYKLRAAGSLAVSYRLAGNFIVEAREGHDDKWLRLVVRKDRKSEFNFAADFGFNAEVDLKDLPQSADDFLSARSVHRRQD